MAGYPLVDVHVELVDGSYHEVDSSELSFKIAGSMALREAMPKASPGLLEPVMRVEVVTPEPSTGDVIGDLVARRGQIAALEMHSAGLQAIGALVPLAEMFGYANDLRSATQGRATYTMEFARYAEAPNNIAQEIISKSQTN